MNGKLEHTAAPRINWIFLKYTLLYPLVCKNESKQPYTRKTKRVNIYFGNMMTFFTAHTIHNTGYGLTSLAITSSFTRTLSPAACSTNSFDWVNDDDLDYYDYYTMLLLLFLFHFLVSVACTTTNTTTISLSQLPLLYFSCCCYCGSRKSRPTHSILFQWQLWLRKSHPQIITVTAIETLFRAASPTPSTH